LEQGLKQKQAFLSRLEEEKQQDEFEEEEKFSGENSSIAEEDH